VWTAVVALFVVFAAWGPVKIIGQQDGGGSSEAAADGSGGTRGTVTMAQLKYDPATLTVARGTEVVFENKDVAPHTVTARSGPVDSGVLAPGKSFALVVDGPFDYFCEIHPSMTAKIALSG
jgi:plastocyanin